MRDLTLVIIGKRGIIAPFHVRGWDRAKYT